MAEEPQPEIPGPVPTSAEKSQEAAALSNLSAHSVDDVAESSKTSNADTAALGTAVSNLSIVEKEDEKTGSGTTGEKAGDSGAEVKKVKVDQKDVAFLVEELEVSKKRATEMLQAAGGDRSSAVKTFVLPVKA